MHKSSLITLALLGVASAANSTTSLWLVGFDQQSILGSVIASDATATTYSLACGDADNCGLPTPFTFTQGPSTVHYSYTVAEIANFTETVQLGCVVTSSASGVCSFSLDAVSVFSSTTTTPFTDASDLGMMAVTLTAGATGVANTPATTTGSSKSTATSGSSSNGSSVSQNGGMPMITQAPWVMGALAAGLAIAAV